LIEKFFVEVYFVIVCIDPRLIRLCQTQVVTVKTKLGVFKHIKPWLDLICLKLLGLYWLNKKTRNVLVALRRLQLFFKVQPDVLLNCLCARPKCHLAPSYILADRQLPLLFHVVNSYPHHRKVSLLISYHSQQLLYHRCSLHDDILIVIVLCQHHFRFLFELSPKLYLRFFNENFCLSQSLFFSLLNHVIGHSDELSDFIAII
jgi:hypothetical protein